MAEDRGSDDPALAAIARHALHDEELIAAFAAGDVEDPGDVERARGLVDRCPTCRDLHHDLAAIRTAIRASGTAAQRAPTLAAPRDFRLRAADAARLRPGSPVGGRAPLLGWRARLRRGVAAFGRPVGAAMTTFGIVGLLVGSLALSGGPLASMTGAAAPSAAPEVDGAGPAPGSTEYRASSGPLESARDGSLGPAEAAGGSGGASATMLLLGGSVALVVLGIGLIVAARRQPAGISAAIGN